MLLVRRGLCRCSYALGLVRFHPSEQSSLNAQHSRDLNFRHLEEALSKKVFNNEVSFSEGPPFSRLLRQAGDIVGLFYTEPTRPFSL
ncbi:hypothetical protein EVAR_87864_1 [Eumeta japonica]|uniref:Uncharacterized protein n=1 Tax=Eumeta variegata TaxID=151549 RepID=A0A4C1WVY8_EUMVA|nr:hypothetical protein EVAR_87864_1 [Eumeta japonica]